MLREKIYERGRRIKRRLKRKERLIRRSEYKTLTATKKSTI